MNAWYETLNRPPLTPPNWVFSPVWTVLYIMIAVSIVLYYRAPGNRGRKFLSAVLIVHLLSNFAWTYLFFGLRSPGLALVDILFLDLSLVLLITCFWRASVISGALLVPYMLWVSFATYLNLGFWWLNR